MPCCLAVFNLIFTGLHGPYISHTPRSDDLDIWSQSLDAKLETDLVITFTSSTVADSNGVLLFLQSQPGVLAIAGRAMEVPKKILVLIDSACFYTWHNVVVSRNHLRYLQCIIWKHRKVLLSLPAHPVHFPVHSLHSSRLHHNRRFLSAMESGLWCQDHLNMLSTTFSFIIFTSFLLSL